MPASSRRLFVLLGTVAVIGGAVGVYLATQPGGKPVIADEKKEPREQPAAEMARMWPLFGGHVNRNMVNTTDRGIPDEWEVRKDQQKQNLKWVAKLGSRSYGGPVIAGGISISRTPSGLQSKKRCGALVCSGV